MMERKKMTTAQLKAALKKRDMAVRKARQAAGLTGGNKYGAEKCGGHDSKKEHRRAMVLRAMERAGLISELAEQVKFVLVPAQRDEGGKLMEREAAYVADFVYTDSGGRKVVEDCKGFRTEVYRLKRKLMLWIHGIRIYET